MGNDSRIHVRVAMYEWTDNRKGRGWDELKIYDKESDNKDRVFGDVAAFMIERGYTKTTGFSRQLLRMYFWEDIKRMAQEEAQRMNGSEEKLVHVTKWSKSE